MTGGAAGGGGGGDEVDDAPTAYCGNCGDPLDHDQTYCLECGAPTALAPAMRRTRRPAVILAGAAIVLGLGTGALAYAGTTRDAGPAGAASAPGLPSTVPSPGSGTGIRP